MVGAVPYTLRMTVHQGLFGSGKRTARFTPYLTDEIDDRYYVGLPPDDLTESSLRIWCEDMLGDEETDWGVERDEFYSPLSSGLMFWFAHERDFDLFRMAWCM